MTDRHISFEEYCLTLENDRKFYDAYLGVKQAGPCGCIDGTRRHIIRQSCIELKMQPPFIDMANKLNAYFNDRYELGPAKLWTAPPELSFEEYIAILDYCGSFGHLYANTTKNDYERARLIYGTIRDLKQPPASKQMMGRLVNYFNKEFELCSVPSAACSTNEDGERKQMNAEELRNNPVSTLLSMCRDLKGSDDFEDDYRAQRDDRDRRGIIKEYVVDMGYDKPKQYSTDTLNAYFNLYFGLKPALTYHPLQPELWDTMRMDLPASAAIINAAPTLQGEKSMGIKIEHKTFVNGSDVKNYNDDQIFDLIRQTEAEIASLDKIQNKPKKLVAKIEALQQGIKDLTELVDSRDNSQ